MPSIKINADLDVNNVNTGSGTIPVGTVEAEGSFGRTTCNFKVNCYPFGESNALFVAAGVSFGGNKIFKLKGHSEAVKAAIAAHPEIKGQVYAELDKYNLAFNDNGDVVGDVRVNSLRPYLGLGYGRLIPKHRVGFRFELGCQFHGKLKAYQGGKQLDTTDLKEANDDISKIVDKFMVYPVLKFSLTGRIL